MADHATLNAVGLADTTEQPPEKVRARPLANRNFRLLWLGENVSYLGDQFYVVALPWLVFQLTGSPVAFGAILMVAGIPRAILMLVGGVITDRFSPRNVMLISNACRLVITVILTLLVLTGSAQVWMLYVIAFCFGVVDAFFQPAIMAITPSLVEPHELQASNALMQGSAQIIGVVGPGVAGILVSAVGMVVSFAFDAWTFLFTAVMLLLMRVPPMEKAKSSAEKRGSVLGEIGEMLGYVRRDSALSTVLMVALALNFLLTGPMVVGTAVLAKDRFVEGSVALGLMLSSLAVGSLLGTVAGGVLHPKRFGILSMMLIAVAGIGLALLGIAPTLPMACAILAIMGASFGFTNILIFTWLQKRIAPELMGRVMSLIGLSGIGLAPISNGLAGVLAALSVPLMLGGAGVLLVVVCVVAGSNAEMRSIQA